MKSQKINIILIILIIILTLSSINIRLNDEIFCSIKSGQDILENGITSLDKYCYADELEYKNPQWLFDLIIGYIYNILGFNGIYILSYVFSILLIVSVFFIINRIGNNKFIAFISVIIIIFLVNKDYLLNNVFFISPNLILYILCALEMLYIEEYIEKLNKKYIVMLILNSVILVNVNAINWIYYILIFISYLLENIIGFFYNKNKNNDKIEKIEMVKDSQKNVKLFMVFIMLILSGFANPNGPIALIDGMKIITNKTIKSVFEYSPITIRNSVSFICVFIYVFSIMAFTKIKFKISDIIMLIMSFCLTILSTKNLPFLIFISMIVNSRNVEKFLKLYLDSEKEINKIINSKKILLFFTVSIIIISMVNVYLKKENEFIDNNFPLEIKEYITKNLKNENVRLFNNAEIGGYLIFNNIDVFIDSRYYIYIKEFNETSIFNEYKNIEDGEISYRTIFEKYNINYVLINKNNIINTYIKKDENYINVCEEEKFILYKKIRGN